MTTYKIHPSPTGNDAGAIRTERDVTIVVVGCGGTGGFLAEATSRLLLGTRSPLALVDPDRVEPHNVARQAFEKHDVGRFKAEVLA
ncbi:MAG: ThiF family adenylyltransferase, partial [Candidatus Dormibacteraceae bacterium]